jgi:hypothetical protein
MDLDWKDLLQLQNDTNYWLTQTTVKKWKSYQIFKTLKT